MRTSKHKENVEHWPTLNTILMVEKILEKNRDISMKVSDLKKKLPKQIMHSTLKIILMYLFQSGKIIYGPGGVQWIYTEQERLKKMMHNALEV
ncbi:MAG: hypothetical protein NTX24_05030 [Candidatus Pacearchaeota archaeon]|nr:hypothetical protein [Candidatus Pacearchaeota archaeon]